MPSEEAVIIVVYLLHFQPTEGNLNNSYLTVQLCGCRIPLIYDAIVWGYLFLLHWQNINETNWGMLEGVLHLIKLNNNVYLSFNVQTAHVVSLLDTWWLVNAYTLYTGCNVSYCNSTSFICFTISVCVSCGCPYHVLVTFIIT
jgi:hypothetical protein